MARRGGTEVGFEEILLDRSNLRVRLLEADFNVVVKIFSGDGVLAILPETVTYFRSYSGYLYRIHL